MKKQLLMIALMISLGLSSWAQEELAPYLGVQIPGDISSLSEQIQDLISNEGFHVIGQYQVADRDDLLVLCFTREDLKKVCEDFEDRGALASVLKVALRKVNDSVELSLLHPNYMFYAYFGDDYKIQAPALKKIDQDAKKLIKGFGEAQPFGGGLTADDLEKYHYKVMMPYFDDPVELEEYASFEEGLKYIQDKISESGDDIKLVYQLIDERRQTAVFGIGLLNVELGEPSFLPIIGERHIAAMPYDIILQGNTVTMLHGKYRFALYWPELTMGTFMKIMSTPGDVEDAMESITEKED
ncbi:hypothetical protein [Lentimicrobium sp. S6]|uniref:hypothetical protein n=2 Tax=unclassified Lentimicrobium TaxID=2677434 RepID=UPI0015540F02|nr:hypothetical protein [Lentimicrobium sp. S6]NPD47163.1 hypothetical protein [Lentimicrobium sp. S6]